MLGERKWYLNTHFYYSPMQNWATANVGSRNKSLQQIERGMQKTYSAAARFFWKGQVLFHSLRSSIHLLLSIVNMHVSNCGKICSVGRAVNGRTGRAEGRRPDQYSGSWFNWEMQGTTFALQAVRPSRDSDDHVKWRSRLQYRLDYQLLLRKSSLQLVLSW